MALPGAAGAVPAGSGAWIGDPSPSPLRELPGAVGARARAGALTTGRAPAKGIGMRLAAILAAAALGGCAPAPSPAPAGPPARIVSLAPSITEVVYALGAGERLVGVCAQCDYPAAVASLPRVGGYLAPSVEVTLARRPDLVIAAPSPGNREAVRAIERAGVRVLVVHDRTLADLWASIRAVAGALGTPAAGERLVADVTARPPHLTAGRLATATAVLACLLAATLAATSLVGPVHVSLARALAAPESTDAVILFRTRLPRVLLGAVVGGSLAAAGAALQALLGNPLACPHLLGISGGAAVAGVLALVAGADAVSPVVPLAAFAGALGAIAIVALGARAGGRTTPHAVLLVGVVFNALAAATLMLLNALASYTQAQGVLFWIMGSLSTQSYRLIAGAALYSLVGLAWLGLHAQDLNLLAAGEEGAQQLGVEVERTRRAVFLAASLLV